MIDFLFIIPEKTMVWFHEMGKGYNINTDFGRRLTHKEATYTLDDVWFMPPDVSTIKRPATQIEEATPEGWPAELRRSIGFSVPPNPLNVDYIVVPFISIKWRKITGNMDDSTSAVNDARKQLRKLRQADPSLYFPGKLPK